MPTMPRIVLLITNSFVNNIRLLYLHEFADAVVCFTPTTVNKAILDIEHSLGSVLPFW